MKLTKKKIFQTYRYSDLINNSFIKAVFDKIMIKKILILDTYLLILEKMD